MAQNRNQALIKVAQHQDQVLITVELDQDQVLTRVGLDQDWVSGRCGQSIQNKLSEISDTNNTRDPIPMIVHKCVFGAVMDNKSLFRTTKCSL